MNIFDEKSDKSIQYKFKNDIKYGYQKKKKISYLHYVYIIIYLVTLLCNFDVILKQEIAQNNIQYHADIELNELIELIEHGILFHHL